MHTKNDATNGREDIVTSISDPELKSGSLPFHSQPNPPSIIPILAFSSQTFGISKHLRAQSRKSIKFMFMKYIGSFCIKGDTLHVIVRLVYRLFCCLSKVWMKVAYKLFPVSISFAPFFLFLPVISSFRCNHFLAL